MNMLKGLRNWIRRVKSKTDVYIDVDGRVIAKRNLEPNEAFTISGDQLVKLERQKKLKTPTGEMPVKHEDE